MKSDFMSAFCGQQPKDFKQPKLNFSDRFCISNGDLLFCCSCKPQFIQYVFEFVAIAKRKPPTYTIKAEGCLNLRGIFSENESTRVFFRKVSFTIELVSN